MYSGPLETHVHNSMLQFGLWGVNLSAFPAPPRLKHLLFKRHVPVLELYFAGEVIGVNVVNYGV